MIKEGKFGIHEAVCLLTITISSKIFFTSPAFLTRFVGTSNWIVTILSNLTSILSFTVILILLKRFPGKNIVEIFDSSVGRICGFIFSLLFAVSYFQGASVLIREFTEVMHVYTFTEMSSSLIIGQFVIAVAIAAFLGLETIARVSKLFAYFMLFGFIALIVLSSENFNYRYIFPILGEGIGPTIVHGLERSSAYAEVTVVTVFAGSLQGIKNIKKSGYISLAISGTIYIAAFLAMLMTFSYSSLQELTSPLYTIARLIKYGPFYQRLDTVFLFLWSMASFITVSVLFYSTVSIYCKMFKFQDARPAVVSMAVLLFAAAMAPIDFSSIVYSSVQKLREYGWIVFYGLPLIALIAATIRRKKGVVSNA